MQTLPGRLLAGVVVVGLLLLTARQAWSLAAASAAENAPPAETTAKTPPPEPAAAASPKPESPAAAETPSAAAEVTPAAATSAAPSHAKETHANATAEVHEATRQVINSIYILVLAGFVGFEVIGRVSPLLHTPLMSATNAISGISLVGSLVAAGSGELGTVSHVLGFIAVTAATINVVGGFMITDRMLRMFKLRGKGHA